MENRDMPPRVSSSNSRLSVVLGIAVVIVIASAGFVWFAPRPRPVARTVEAPASEVLMNLSNIPEIGWGVRGTGTGGTSAWRLFAVHNELILASLNVTLWVAANSTAASHAMEAIAGSIPYATQDAAVAGADASLVWTYSFGQYGSLVARRYNIVFLMDAHLETSFALTRSDFARWAGWQLTRVETLAT
jgi:hypothetical protein